MPNDTYLHTYISRGATGGLPRSNPDATTKPEIVNWLRSALARSYEGHWVLLRPPNLDVIDSDLSPSALKTRHPDQDPPLIVYVRPQSASLIG